MPNGRGSSVRSVRAPSGPYGAWASSPLDLRPLPDFLVVGAKRGGTTSFLNYLQQHEGIVPLFPRVEKIKGLYFFDEHYGRGVPWYRSHFVTAGLRRRLEVRVGHRPATGEASPYYLFHPLAPARAANVVPDAHIVALAAQPRRPRVSHIGRSGARTTPNHCRFATRSPPKPSALAGEAHAAHRGPRRPELRPPPPVVS